MQTPSIPRTGAAVRALGLLVGLAGSAYGQSAQFTDQTAAAGLTCSHASDPASSLEFMSGGGAVIDYNRDGWQDLFVFGGLGNPDKLFRNNGDGTFTDVAASAGVARNQRGKAVAVGDINRDGWPDLFTTVEAGTPGYGLNSLWLNNGDGTFTDAAAAWGVAGYSSPTSGGGWGASLGDYNLDGRLDLAIGEWLSPSSIRNRLYRNSGTNFVNATNTSGIGSVLLGSKGFSPIFCDMNGDRYPELLWVSDFGASKYFINNTNGTFTEATAASGTGRDLAGMGTTIADFNNDGRPDWFVTAIYLASAPVTSPGNMLYINQGSHHFVESGAAWGVNNGDWGWGSVSADFNLDGQVDLAHTNGYPTGATFTDDPSRVFMNSGGTCSQVAPTCGITHTGQGRGMINFDYDNDGDQDVVIFTNGGPLVLYRNDTPRAGNHFLRVLLSARGTGNAPDGIGAHVVVTTPIGARHFWVNANTNYVSQSETSAHFGLGAATFANEVRVDWPDGTQSTWTNVGLDQSVRLKARPADFDDDGAITVSDLFAFLDAWFSQFGTDGPPYPAPSADFDLSGPALGGVTVADLFGFLDAWFAGFGT